MATDTADPRRNGWSMSSAAHESPSDSPMTSHRGIAGSVICLEEVATVAVEASDEAGVGEAADAMIARR